MALALWWLFFNFVTIVILAFYSMTEMACVSFNKVRLHYYVSKGMKRAVWLNTLLQNPGMLFGTTLIGVNVAMVAGSECSREFHSAIGLSPDLAPLSQVLLVVILGELAPMFAARHFAEHVAMWGAPLLYASARLIAPILWIVNLISKACRWLSSGKETESHIFLSQEELQKILEEQEEDLSTSQDQSDFNAISTNIFRLREKEAKDVKIPFKKVPMLPSDATIVQMRNLLKKQDADYVPLYHRHTSNILGIAFPRDLVRIDDHLRVRDYARPPWFITANTKVTQIIKQFRHNNQTIAIVLDRQGHAIGLINLDDLLEEIFGKPPALASKREELLALERSFPGDMKVEEFNAQFGVELHEDDQLTLSELMTIHLGHNPDVGENIYIKPFELTVSESSLLDVKTVMVKTKRG